MKFHQALKMATNSTHLFLILIPWSESAAANIDMMMLGPEVRHGETVRPIKAVINSLNNRLFPRSPARGPI